MRYFIVVIAALAAAAGCSGKHDGTTAGASAKFERTMDTTYVTAEGTRIDKFRIKSPSMEREIKAVVVMPPAYETDKDKKFPVLYTLHGRGAPYDTWANMSKLRSQLKDKPFIYTCFDGDDRGYYVDAVGKVVTARKKKDAEADTTKRKSLFMTFFYKEFLPAIDSWYRVDAENRAITGFSMGGCGAITYALQQPQTFRSVSGLSSVFHDLDDTSRTNKKAALLGPLAENRARYEEIDTYLLLKKWKEQGVALPPIYQHIGTEDFLLEDNRKLAAYAKELGIDFTYEESEGGHNWKFWHPASVGVAEFHWKHFEQ